MNDVPISLRDVTVVLGGRTILDGLKWELRRGQCAVILGPSGGGKSVFLQTLLGFMTPDAGEVALNPGATGSSPFASLAVMFQEDALIEDASVGTNLAMAAEERWIAEDIPPEPATREAVDGALREVQLDPARVRDALPSALSGGMRRRVALARALVRRPAVLVADEPTTGLDAASAARVYDLLGELIPRRAMSALIVTHDPACASRLGFPVYYFSPVAGRMPQWTPPPEAATPEARHADLLAWIAHQAQTHQARQADSPAEPAQPSTHVPRAGACLNRMIESLGRLGLLLGGLRPPLNAPAIRRDLLTWGAGALPLTFLIFVLFGAVMQIQAEQAVVEYGFSNELPGLVALSLLRICPFLTGFLLAGRSGSAITARIGGMQLGGQFRALRTMRIEPERALFGPLFWALTLAAPALTAISLGLGALGALAVLASPLSRAKITATFFLSVFPAYLTAGEWLLLLVKAALMGAGLAVIVYGMGARPKRSPEAVSAAITRGLVLSFVWMALVDTMLSLTFQ